MELKKKTKLHTAQTIINIKFLKNKDKLHEKKKDRFIRE